MVYATVLKHFFFNNQYQKRAMKKYIKEKYLSDDSAADGIQLHLMGRSYGTGSITTSHLVW